MCSDTEPVTRRTKGAPGCRAWITIWWVVIIIFILDLIIAGLVEPHHRLQKAFFFPHLMGGPVCTAQTLQNMSPEVLHNTWHWYRPVHNSRDNVLCYHTNFCSLIIHPGGQHCCICIQVQAQRYMDMADRWYYPDLCILDSECHTKMTGGILIISIQGF